ncbi:MAG: methyltransferase [Acholeplasmataceae bacterium]
MDHYFTNNNIKDKPINFKVYIFNKRYEFLSNQGVFSKNKIDFGTNLLLNTIQITNEKSLLDLGSGIGIMGIILKDNYPNLRITLSDVNKRALTLAKTNANQNKVLVNIIESNLFENIEDKFDVVISNPPIRAGKKITYKLYEDAYKHLNKDGSLWIVIRKAQGAKTTYSFLTTIYSEVVIVNKKNGYYIVKAIK